MVRAGRAGIQSPEEYPEQMRVQQRASFFDVDNTLIQGDTQEMEGRALMAGLHRSPGRILTGIAILAAMGAHRLGWISQARQNKSYLKIYRGRHRSELETLGRRIFEEEVRPRILKEALAVLESRREKKDLIVLVSATTRHLLGPLEEMICPDRVFCTDLEFDRWGRATGRPLNGICIGPDKADRVRAFADGQGLDLADCHAYSDHPSDLPLLNSVGHPEVINPTRKLEACALKAGWPVHRFHP